MLAMSVGAKRWWVLGAIVSALSVSLAALAFACTIQATLDVNPVTVRPGEVIQVTGEGYDWSPLSSPVQLRLSGPAGSYPLGDARATLAFDYHGHVSFFGEIDVLLEIPTTVTPGTYTMIAEQTDAAGREVAGTPGRAAVLVD